MSRPGIINTPGIIDNPVKILTVILVAALGLHPPPAAIGQTAPAPDLDHLELQVNTVNTLELHYVLTFSEEIDRPATLSHAANRALQFSLIDAADGRILASEPFTSVGLRPRRLDFTFQLGNGKKELLHRIFERRQPVYVQLSGDLSVSFPGSNDPYVLTPGHLKQLTTTHSSLSERQLAAIKAYHSGSGFALKNNLDIGREVKSADTASADYAVNFDILNTLDEGIPLYVKAKGRIGTDPGNPLNHTEFYLAYRKPGSELFIEAGRIGNQDFSGNSFRLNAGLETLLPNLIDLTGGAPRLRLKPYLKVALAFQKNYSSANPFGNNKVNLLVTGEGYYHIPIGERFFSILTADGNYSDAFAGDKFPVAYEMSIGYQTPLNDLKLLFKVQSGKNEVNSSAATRYMIGILMDFLE